MSHSTTICNKVLQAMSLNGLCKYDISRQAYLFEHSNKPVNCSHILVFLKQSACYTVNLNTHQWYRINTNEITNNHAIAICNDNSINIVPLPPAEPSEFNTFGTITRLLLSQNQAELPNVTHTQTISNNTSTPNNDIDNTSPAKMAQTNDQSTTILQQFSMIAKELENFTNKVSHDITKITQVCNTSQEKTGNITSTNKSTKYHYTSYSN